MPSGEKTFLSLRSGGGICPNNETIRSFLECDVVMYDRESLINTISSYFDSITEMVVDDSGKSKRVWTSAPTKSQLALVLGMSTHTLLRYVNNKNAKGNPFSEKGELSKDRMIATADIPILQRAYQVIESFYESKLAERGNPAGSIFWLTNSTSTEWTNDHGKQENIVPEVQKDVLSVSQLPKLN